MSEEKDIELRKKIADALIKARKIVAAHKSEYKNVYTASGGGGTTTSNSSTTVPQDVLNEYNQVTAQANQVAAAPLQQYSGQIVAGQNAPETSAYNTIDNMQGISAPYTQAASGLLGQASQTINPQTVTAAQIQGYESPYTQSVLNTTMAAENNQDAQQQAQLQGNAISSGAWGGDRSAVAQGILGGQQAIANNATNAGILNTGYTTAEQEANTQQQAGLGAQEASQYLQESAGLGENQLGTSALNNTLAGASAQLASGQAQQQQTQAELNVPYEEFLQQQAYPFQTTGWLGNIAEGIGSNEGGSSTSSTTQPSEGLFGLKRGGGIVQRRDDGGGISPLSQGISQNANPFQQNVNSNYSQMSVQQLQQLSQRIPPATPQGQAIQAALKQKQFLPNVAKGGGIVPHYDGGGGAAFDGDYDPSDYAMAPGNAAGIQDAARAGITSIPADDNGYGAMLASTQGEGNGILPAQNITTGPEGQPMPAPTPPVNAPDHPANSGYEANMPTPHEANPWLSVAAGVLGTLAGRSRNPLVDIGQGGLIGLNNYAEQQKVAQAQNYTEGNFHQNAQKLMDEAENTKNQFGEEKVRDAETAQYHQGDLARRTHEVVKDMFGNPTGTFNNATGKFTPMDVSGGSGGAGGMGSNNVPKDTDGTPLTPFQLYSYKNLITKQQPKDIATENTVLPSLIDQKTKVDDLVSQIPIASSGNLHTLADFADRNQIPIFSDPVRANATVLQNYDSMGNVLDNIRSTFGGTGRVLSKEFEGLQNELSVNKSASPEQKAVVVAHIQSKLNDLVQNEVQRAQDIHSGKAYLPSYQSPEQQRLAKIAATPAANPSSMVKVIKPDGTSGSIPQANLASALKAGYQQVP